MESIFNHRAVGIINIDNKLMPAGKKLEFEQHEDDERLTKPEKDGTDFKHDGLAAIGII
ncbi:hypothetical protein MCHI_002041 [Candidatus Magnetoovum chiemensis]|nr:hypothetical protein MCHI_002041 [Candidatus Magnetoovum chiemensis]